MVIVRSKTLAAGVVLFLLAAATTVAQVPQPVPRVTLSAAPASVAPGGRVTFAAHLSSDYPNIRFRFDFGDGMQSDWQSTSVAAHTYQTAGTYRPFVDIGVATGRGVTRLGGSVRRIIQVTHAPVGPVDLFIAPSSAEMGLVVTFTVRTASNNPNIRYRFAFGDGSAAGVWQSSPQATHIYSTSGNFVVSVDVGLMTSRGIQLLGSSRRGVSVPAVASARRPRTTHPGKSRHETRVSKPSEKQNAASAVPKKEPAAAEKSSDSEPLAVTAPPVTPSPALSVQETPADSALVTPVNSGNDWRYLWLLLPLALLVFILGRWIFAPPAAVSHADPGTARVVDAAGLVKKAQVINSPSTSMNGVRKDDG